MSRDTQFKGFAKALWKELEDHPYVEIGQLKDCDREHLYRVIARRAYDLVDIAICHIAMGMSNDSAVMFVPRQNAVNYIPDMTELPKEQEQP